jgi:hypothetical protein
MQLRCDLRVVRGLLRADGNACGPVGGCAYVHAVGSSAQPGQSLTQVMDDDRSCCWMADRGSACLFVCDIEPFRRGVALVRIAPLVPWAS